jgi:hypothetical protein
MLFPGDPGVPVGRAYTPLNHVSPRVGFAYDPYGTGKTVFHGAAGLFFGAVSGNQWEFPSNFAPYAVRNNSYTKVKSLTHPYTGDPTEFPTGANPYPSLAFDYKSGSATFLPFNQLVAFDPHYRWPYSIQINFGFQQQFGKGLALSVNYVGSLNRKSPIYNDINAPQFKHLGGRYQWSKLPGGTDQGLRLCQYQRYSQQSTATQLPVRCIGSGSTL